MSTKLTAAMVDAAARRVLFALRTIVASGDDLSSDLDLALVALASPKQRNNPDLDAETDGALYELQTRIYFDRPQGDELAYVVGLVARAIRNSSGASREVPASQMTDTYGAIALSIALNKLGGAGHAPALAGIGEIFGVEPRWQAALMTMLGDGKTLQVSLACVQELQAAEHADNHRRSGTVTGNA
jgi:hypothetical protein